MNIYPKIRILLIGCCLVKAAVAGVLAHGPMAHYYQLKIYHYHNQAQENRIEQYLKQAYLPALHRASIKEVGVFKPIAQEDTDRRIYVFISFRSLDQMVGLDRRLEADAQYITDGRDYTEADHLDVPYSRLETILLHAFPGMPSPAVPQLTAPKADRVYELRSYESPTEKYNINKVRMFNAGGEIDLFKRLQFNAVFYGEVIAGSHMPNLMYMTSFNSKEDRDKHWESFTQDAEWKTVSAKPEYKNNVSHSDIILLHPAEYSDF